MDAYIFDRVTFGGALAQAPGSPISASAALMFAKNLTADKNKSLDFTYGL